MISKILFHVYAVIALSLFVLSILNDIAYKHAMFLIAQAQANALVILVQKFVGI